MSAKASVRSSITAKVPLGETLGVPSGETVATNPRGWSPTWRFISAVSIIGPNHQFRGGRNLWGWRLPSLPTRSEKRTAELQLHSATVCRLLPLQEKER